MTRRAAALLRELVSVAVWGTCPDPRCEHPPDCRAVGIGEACPRTRGL